MDCLSNVPASNTQLIEEFIDDCRVRGLTEGTITSYRSNINLFCDYFKRENFSLLSITKNDIRRYISHLRETNIDQKTIKNRLSSISSLLDYALYEEYIEKNSVILARKRYLRDYKKPDNAVSKRRLIDVSEMAQFINSIFDIQEQTIALVFAKTGVRRTELLNMDVDDINWEEMSITLKPRKKRSNRVVFFDYETAVLLKRWISQREKIVENGCPALFLNKIKGNRIGRNALYDGFVKWARQAGLHVENSTKPEENFTPHCCRHWFTTQLRKQGMSREFIQELRGDKRRDAIDIYDHIDRDELRQAYLAAIPQLGII